MKPLPMVTYALFESVWLERYIFELNSYVILIIIFQLLFSLELVPLSSFLLHWKKSNIS